MVDVGHTLKLALFIVLGMLTATFVFWWARSVRDQRVGKHLRNESGPSGALSPAQLAIGFVTNFLDSIRDTEWVTSRLPSLQQPDR